MALTAQQQQDIALFIEQSIRPNGANIFPETAGQPPLTPNERIRKALEAFLENREANPEQAG